MWVFQKIQTLNSKEICASMFIAALFTIAKIWKQPKCPSTDGWIKKMWYICTTEHYVAIKKNEIFCDNTDGPRGSYAKRNRSEKDKYYITDCK